MIESMSTTKPDVIEIVADDLGCWAIAYAGNPEIYTPNIDRLASEGIYFVNFFSVSPAGSAARASLLTGRIPSYHGVHDNVCDGNLSVEDGGDEYGQSRSVQFLDGLMGYPDVLAESGYTCGRCGQWNLGDALTPQMSHDLWYVQAVGDSPYYKTPMVVDGKVCHETAYVNDAITIKALEFIRENSDNPYYLSINFPTPHGAWDCHKHPDQLLQRYDECTFDMCPADFTHPWLVDTITCSNETERRRMLAHYYAGVTAVDEGVGRILAYLESQGKRENTLIFFTSGNGINLGHHGVWGGGNGTNPLNMYDTSLKVPTIISMPNTVPVGRIDRTMLSHYDWRPTLMSLLGIEDPELYELPGEDFKEILFGGDVTNRNEIIVLAEYGPARMIRDRHWKYIQRFGDGPDELFYLTMDPGEMINLVDKAYQRARLETLKYDMDRFFEDYSMPGNRGVDYPIGGGGQYRPLSEAGHGRALFGGSGHWVDGNGNPRGDGYIPPDKFI